MRTWELPLPICHQMPVVVTPELLHAGAQGDGKGQAWAYTPRPASVLYGCKDIMLI